MRLLLWISVWLMTCVPFADSFAADPFPRSVLILDPNGPNAPFSTARNFAFQSSLQMGSAAPVSVYSENFDLNRFSDERYQTSLKIHLQEKYRERPISAIVMVGSSRLDFSLSLHAELWPAVPVVLSEVDEAVVARLRLPADVTGTSFHPTLAEMVMMARTLVPNLK